MLNTMDAWALTPHSFILSLIISLINGCVCLYIAKKRGKAIWPWFFVGLFLGIFGLFFLLLIPSSLLKKKPLPPPPLEEEKESLSLPSPSVLESSLWYYLDKENKQVGPISFAELKNKVLTQVLIGTKYIWYEEWEEWRQIQELPPSFFQVDPTKKL